MSAYFQHQQTGEYMYTNAPHYDDDRRLVLTWGGKGEPDNDPTMQWEVLTLPDNKEYCTIKSVAHQEYMYSNAPRPKQEGGRRHVLCWKKAGDPNNDKTSQWLIKDFGEYFGIQNVEHREWMYVGGPRYGEDRRYALLFKTGNPASDPTMRWTMHRTEELVSIAFGDAEIKSMKPKMSNEQELENDGDVVLEASFKYWESKKTTEIVTWEAGIDVKTTRAVKATSGPVGPSLELSQSLELSFSITNTRSWETEDSAGTEQVYKVTLQPRTRVKVTATLYEVECNIPFVATFKSGNTAKGAWAGMAQSKANCTTTDMPL